LPSSRTALALRLPRRPSYQHTPDRTPLTRRLPLVAVYRMAITTAPYARPEIVRGQQCTRVRLSAATGRPLLLRRGTRPRWLVSNLSAHLPCDAMRGRASPRSVSADELGVVVRSMVRKAVCGGRTRFTRQRPPPPWPGRRRMLRLLGGQQRGSSSNRTRPRETPRVKTTTSVGCLVMRGYVGADLLGFLDGMQGGRGSNPLSSNQVRGPVRRRPSPNCPPRAANRQQAVLPGRSSRAARQGAVGVVAW
jgi:hypothetical protein